MLSSSICRSSCARLAPSASRTAISRCRFAPCASSRFATLAQAMQSTSSTTIEIASRNNCMDCRSRGGNAPVGSRWKPSPLSVAGFCVAKREPRTSISACASAWVTPGFNRAATRSHCVPRDSGFGAVGVNCDSVPSGTQNSGARIRSIPRKPFGATPPTTVYLSPPSVTALPAIDGSPWNLRCHKPYPSTTTSAFSSPLAKPATLRQTQLRHVKVIGCRRLAPYALRLTAAANRCSHKFVIGSQARERLRLLAQVAIHRHG